MRLGYLVPEFPSQTHVFFWREIRALRRMGEEIFLVSTRKPSPLTCRHDFLSTALAETHYLFPPTISSAAAWAAADRRGLSSAFEYLGGLSVSGFKSRARQFGLLVSALDLVRWARMKRLDHVHGHSCADAAHVLALARRAGGPPYSLTLHGDVQVYGADHRAKMNGAAFVAAMGDHLRRQLVEQVGLPTGRVFVTCMGVETSELAELGKDRSADRGSLHVVTVARLHPAKGHIHALAAVRAGLQDGLNLHYTIAGEGPFRAALASRICELGLEQRVTLTGTLSETEVYQLLSKADAFVLPSTGLGEAWPVSVMEAMGAGLPVVASEIGATSEIITHGVDGFLVPQGDEEALLEKIVLLGYDVQLRRQIGEAARRTANRRFDVAMTARTLRDAVNTTSSNRHPIVRGDNILLI